MYFNVTLGLIFQNRVTYSSDNTGKCKSGAKMILSKAVNEFAAPKLVGAQEA